MFGIKIFVKREYFEIFRFQLRRKKRVEDRKKKKHTKQTRID